MNTHNLSHVFTAAHLSHVTLQSSGILQFLTETADIHFPQLVQAPNVVSSVPDDTFVDIFPDRGCGKVHILSSKLLRLFLQNFRAWTGR